MDTVGDLVVALLNDGRKEDAACPRTSARARTRSDEE